MAYNRDTFFDFCAQSHQLHVVLLKCNSRRVSDLPVIHLSLIDASPELTN